MSKTYRLEALPAPIASRIMINPVTGCWEWRGGRDEKGYGRYRIDGKWWRVHRLVYTLLVGPIPDGLTIDHVKAWGCKSRACCWPAHLEPVTNAVNVMRGDGACAQHARKTHCKRGHEFTSENTHIRASDGGRDCRACGRARYEEDKAAGLRDAATIVDSDDTCPSGHRYSIENTYLAPNGKRRCRECSRIRAREYYARKRARAQMGDAA